MTAVKLKNRAAYHKAHSDRTGAFAAATQGDGAVSALSFDDVRVRYSGSTAPRQMRAAARARTGGVSGYGGVVQRMLEEGDRFSERITRIGNIQLANIPNMTKEEIILSKPDDWEYTEHNGFVHIRDTDGKIRIRIDPPDKTTNYPHVHVYDSKGNLLDINGRVVDRKCADGHIAYKSE